MFHHARPHKKNFNHSIMEVSNRKKNHEILAANNRNNSVLNYVQSGTCRVFNDASDENNE